MDYIIHFDNTDLYFYDDGLINLTIDIANQWPLVVSIISVLIIPVSNWAWIRYANSKLKLEDFEL
ncbi:hypothetical protein [Piscibacillus salipiscarius]|uniref:hypothetical protein n=1 Tax=Piscibacillus salipiscarius TaxID=299480 RepID=UPI0024364A0C|nr:hypothetical protein [Piscibacillus salipiscarius]